MDEVDETGGDLKTTSIDSTATLDADILLADCKDECCPLGIRVLNVVEWVQRAQKGGILINPQGHSILEINRSGNIVAIVKDNATASVRGHEVDGSLDAHSVERHAIRDCTEVPRKVICGSERLAGSRKKQHCGCKFQEFFHLYNFTGPINPADT